MGDAYQTIKEKIEAGEFEHKLPYPLEEELKKHEKYRKLTKEMSQHAFQIAELRSQRSILISDMKAAHQRESSEINKSFRAAVEEAYGTQDHPKRDKIWMKAWDDSSSGGWGTILSCYDELADLLL